MLIIIRAPDTSTTESLDVMNKVLARSIDKLANDILSPRFNASEAFKKQNLLLLDNPPLPPRRLIKTPKLFLKRIDRKGSLDTFEFAFPSRVETSYLKNNTVYGRYYKLNDRIPKSTIILLHGMYENSHRYLKKHALNLIGNGHNCLVIALPYHIERTPKGSQSGSQFLSTNLQGIFEALQQALKDVLALVNWLISNGEKTIGLMGIDVGALVAGLVASATRKINYLILLAPAVTPLQVTGYARSEEIVSSRIRMTGLTQEQFLGLFEPWSLIHHKPLTPADRTFLIKASHDLIVPGDSVEKMWSAWGEPKISRLEHGHLSILATRRIFKDINAFLNDSFAHKTSAGLLK